MLFRAAMKIALLFFVALTPMVATAQQTGATVHGSVADPENAVIPGATVTFTPSSGKALVTQSQSDGTYTLRNVPPGNYAVTVTMQGFASFVKQGVRITAGQALTLDAKMATFCCRKWSHTLWRAMVKSQAGKRAFAGSKLAAFLETAIQVS